MAFIDWAILILYLVGAVSVGFLVRKRASRGLRAYFLANSSMPWWLIGISMVATTFAADTPLAVTGIVAREGIAGNWFWWSLALAHLLAIFLFSGYWRSSGVVTDAELIELRYDGKSATVLRAFKAFFFAIITNCLTMAWVIRAVGKISVTFFDWQKWLPEGWYRAVESVWPEWISISSPSEALSILVMAAVALIYATLGGLTSVIITDLVQFILAMSAAILFAGIALAHVGGPSALVAKLNALYPNARDYLSFVPTTNNLKTSLYAFLVFVAIQWWAQHNSDSGGYFAQRAMAAKNEQHARYGTLLFVILHYVVRTWPWIVVGLVALVVYPEVPGNIATHLPADYQRVLSDRESAYPLLMLKLLPPGLLGITVASLVAAFMSTIDTHINWGSSYLVNDIYKRFINRKATDRQLVLAGRVATVIVFVIALAVTTQINSIKKAWEFLTLLGAGLGLPHILRWIWWRVTAVSELVSLITAALGALLLLLLYPNLQYHHKLLIVVLASGIAMFTATYLSRPVAEQKLQEFVQRVNPVGFWPRKYRTSDSINIRPLVAWMVSVPALYLSLFAIGNSILGSSLVALVMGAASIAAWSLALKIAGWIGNKSKQA